MAQATVLCTLKIDVSPDGIKFTIDGLDTDLAQLIQEAGTFESQTIEFNNIDTSNVYITSTKKLAFVDKPAT